MKLTSDNLINSVLAMATAATCIASHVNADPLRFKVKGKVDPATGYRIEYTVGSRFQQEEMLKHIKQADQHYFEFVRFRPESDPASANGGNASADGKSSSQPKGDKPL